MSESSKLTRILGYPRRHFLDSALGITGVSRIDTLEFIVAQFDRILMTTDGVHELISKKMIRDLSLSILSIEELVKRIIQEVETKGATDNFTILGFNIP